MEIPVDNCAKPRFPNLQTLQHRSRRQVSLDGLRGHSLQQPAALPARESFAQVVDPERQNAFFKTFTFPKPLVAAVNGHAIAGGCVLACACDYRVMAEGSGRIGTPELSVGVPFPSMAMEVLRLVVPPHRLQAVVYQGLTCAPDDALANGFIDETAPPEALVDRAAEVAARLGALPRASFSLTKRLIRQPGRDRVVRYMRSVDEEVLEAWTSAPVQAAVRAYVDRTLRK